MKKRILLSSVALCVILSLPALGSDVEKRIAQIDDQIRQLQSEKDYLLSLTDETEAPVLTAYAPGQYKVGVDIPAGEYILFSTDLNYNGYFFETRDSNGNDFVKSDGFSYNAIITISEGNYLELSRAKAIPSELNPPVDTSGEGYFEIGRHLPAGEYKLTQVDDSMSGYYFVYTDSTLEHFAASDSFTGQAYVSVQDGQILELSNSKIVK